MKTGGYQIIDFSSIAAGDGSESIPGIFATIKAAKKPIFISNLMGVNGFSYDNNPTSTSTATLPFIVGAGNSLALADILIGSDDSVTIET